MAARRRQRSREGWPKYLYQNPDGYFYWRNPLDGKTFGLGTDPDKAKDQAIEANRHIEQGRKRASLVDRLTGNDVQTVSAVVCRVLDDLARNQSAKNTIKTKATLVRSITAEWGDLPYSALTTAMIDEFLMRYIAEGKNRMARAYQSFLTELGNAAIAMGFSTFNPAAVTRQIRVQVKRSRLSLDQFIAIYDAAGKLDPYVQRAMELALVTAQRREDIALWERSDIHDGHLWVEQHKSENTAKRGMGTQSRLAIPLDLRMFAQSGDRVIDWTLKNVIQQCRGDHVASKMLIHHSRKRTKSNPGDPVWKDTITKSFAKARDLAGIDGGDKEPPTFHEIRSLSIRIWQDQRGKDFAQALAGHKQASTTDIYADSRGSWVILKSA